MARVVVHSKVGPDGTLHLDVPLGIGEANRPVRVIVEELATGTPRVVSRDEWPALVQRLAGSVTDSEFRRHDQGALEARTPL